MMPLLASEGWVLAPAVPVVLLVLAEPSETAEGGFFKGHDLLIFLRYIRRDQQKTCSAEPGPGSTPVGPRTRTPLSPGVFYHTVTGH